MKCIFAFCLAPGDNWILDKEVINHMLLTRLPCDVNQSAPNQIDQWDTSRSRTFHLPIPSIGLLSQGWCWAGAQPNILEHAWNVKKTQNSPPQRSLSRCKSHLLNKTQFSGVNYRTVPDSNIFAPTDCPAIILHYLHAQRYHVLHPHCWFLSSINSPKAKPHHIRGRPSHNLAMAMSLKSPKTLSPLHISYGKPFLNSMRLRLYHVRFIG